MEQVLQEINKHKTKLISLINNLINTELINEEIFINNEIKKESECLISLLNAKQNIVMNQINLNNNVNFNPLMFPGNPLMMNIPTININQMNPPFIQNISNINEQTYSLISIIFQKDISDKKTTVYCNPQEKISDVIKKYREKSNDYAESRFIFCSRELEPSLSLSELGITNGDKILVSTKGILKGSI